MIRVLLVDDQPALRSALHAVLDRQGDIEVVGEAQDGEDAVLAAHLLHPDVVIMDVSMPKMNGIEATEHISADSPNTKVIGLSMYNEVELEDLMKRAGATVLIT